MSLPSPVASTISLQRPFQHACKFALEGIANTLILISPQKMDKCGNKIIETLQHGDIHDFIQNFHDPLKECLLSVALTAVFKTLLKELKDSEIKLVLASTEFNQALLTFCKDYLEKRGDSSIKPSPLQHQIKRNLLILLNQIQFLHETHNPIMPPSGNAIYPQSPLAVRQAAKLVKSPHPVMDTPKLDIQILLQKMDKHYAALTILRKHAPDLRTKQKPLTAVQKSEIRLKIMGVEDYAINLDKILQFHINEIKTAFSTLRHIPGSFVFACTLLKSLESDTSKIELTDLMPLVPIRACLDSIDKNPIKHDQDIDTLFQLIHLAATMLCLQSSSIAPATNRMTPHLNEHKTLSNLKLDLVTWFKMNTRSKLLIEAYIECYILAISKGGVEFVLSLSNEDTSMSKLETTILRLANTPSFGWPQLYTALTHTTFPSKQRASYQLHERSLVQEVIQIQLNDHVKPAYKKLVSKQLKDGYIKKAVSWEMLLLLRQLYDATIHSQYESWNDSNWMTFIALTQQLISKLPTKDSSEIYLSEGGLQTTTEEKENCKWGLVGWLKLYLPNIPTENKKIIFNYKISNIEFEAFGLYSYVVLGDVKKIKERLEEVAKFEMKVQYKYSWLKHIGKSCLNAFVNLGQSGSASHTSIFITQKRQTEAYLREKLNLSKTR